MAIFIKPVNKMLLVEREPVPEKKNEFGILMPVSINKIIEQNTIVKLVSTSEDSIYEKYEGKKLLVHSSMLEDINVKGTTGTLISENGVIAIISESGML